MDWNAGVMTYWIDIRCRNSAHVNREAKIQTFRRFDGDDTWQPELIAKHNLNENAIQAAFEPRDDPTTVMLIADQLAKEHQDNPYLPVQMLPSYNRPGMKRERYSLTCKLCGLKVDVRPETLYPILDRIIDTLSTTREFHGGGIVCLEFAHLAGMIGRARRRA